MGAICLLIGFFTGALGRFRTAGEFFGVFRASPLAYLIGIGGLGGYSAFYYTALKMAPIIEANLVNYLWPLFIVIFSALFLKKKVGRYQVVGVVIGFLGAAVVLSGKGDFHFKGANLLSYAPAFLGALTWGLYSTLTHVVHFEKSFMTVVYLFCSIFLFAGHFLTEESYYFQGYEFIPIAVLGIGTISYTFWDYAMKKGSIVMLATLAYFVPFFSTLWLVVFRRGDWNKMTLLGGFLIVIGSMVANCDKIKTLLRKKSASP